MVYLIFFQVIIQADYVQAFLAQARETCFKSLQGIVAAQP
jgi:LysR family transcriptional regulator for metE and metH